MEAVKLYQTVIMLIVFNISVVNGFELAPTMQGTVNMVYVMVSRSRPLYYGIPGTVH